MSHASLGMGVCCCLDAKPACIVTCAEEGKSVTSIECSGNWHPQLNLVLKPTAEPIMSCLHSILSPILHVVQVMAIEPKWLVELAPRFFKPADKHKLSRRKRWERIEPLYDKYNDPVAWRLSKRRG